MLFITLDLIASAKGEVRIVAPDASWLTDLSAGLLESRLNGHRVRVIVEEKAEQGGYEVLSALGAEVCCVAGSPGTLTMPIELGPVSAKKAIWCGEMPYDAHLSASAHNETGHVGLGRVFEGLWLEGRVRPASTPILRQISLADIVDTLRFHVPAYKGAQVNLEEVSIAKVRPLTNDVEMLKLERVACIGRILEQQDVRVPLSVVGTPWGFYPPIVELQSDGICVLIDGIHRFYSARRDGNISIAALVVSGVADKLPGAPLMRFEPVICVQKRERVQRYVEYDPGGFRPIRKALQNGSWAVEWR